MRKPRRVLIVLKCFLAASCSALVGVDRPGVADGSQISQSVEACGATVGSIALPSGEVVDARSNGGCTESDCSCAGPIATGLGYQCVELVQRFMTVYTHGEFSGLFPVATAKELCTMQLPPGFVRAETPQRYDIFVRTVNAAGGASQFGHTAIVTDVTPTEMTLLQQNKYAAVETVSRSKFAGHQCFIRYPVPASLPTPPPPPPPPPPPVSAAQESPQTKPAAVAATQCDAQKCAVYGAICCGSGVLCVNPWADANNCGGCGIHCAAGATCSAGKCVKSLTCTSTQIKNCGLFGCDCANGQCHGGYCN